MNQCTCNCCSGPPVGLVVTVADHNDETGTILRAWLDGCFALQVLVLFQDGHLLQFDEEQCVAVTPQPSTNYSGLVTTKPIV